MEIWKSVKNYEGVYEVSNLGNVKSLSRIILRNGKYPFKCKEKIIKQNISNGRYHVDLYKNGIGKTFKVHQLVSIAFYNHVPNGYYLVINHKDFNPLNNKLDNLEIVTQRENSNLKHIKSSSQYVGVSWRKQSNKWKASIYINGKQKHLGLFLSEIEASISYEKSLKDLHS